ncbi:hypothetical protein D5S17_20000 [Pseudonocardiaceae bacterium YIM PH 21723]|nr:hypothetical protein D5S17_20000 [Pseudonocardiaceae bacterium YIM PH 21723]
MLFSRRSADPVIRDVTADPPFADRTVRVSYSDGSVVDLRFEGALRVRWDGGVALVSIARLGALRHLLTWTQPDGTMMVQVQDWRSHTVTADVTYADGRYVGLTGTFSVVPAVRPLQ